MAFLLCYPPRYTTVIFLTCQMYNFRPILSLPPTFLLSMPCLWTFACGLMALGGESALILMRESFGLCQKKKGSGKVSEGVK